MMRLFLAFLTFSNFFTSHYLAAGDAEQEDMLAVSADRADYTDGVMTLTGHVVVGYELGVLCANTMTLQSMSNENKVAVDHIEAKGDVVVKYGEDFTAIADYTVFQRECSAEEKGGLAGVITLSCEPQKLCRVTSLEGDEILSDEIQINTMKQEWTFTFPKGSLKSLGNASSTLDFTAKKLIWNDQTSKLVLTDDVEIYQQGMGKLQTCQDVHVTLMTVEGKKVPRVIETCGEALLTYIDQDTQLDHTLRSYGSLRIDHQKMEAKLKSPEIADGSVMEGKQVFFKDAKGEIYADKAFVKYDYMDGKIVPVRIVLQGDVKITNNLEKSAEDKTATEQYIVADRVDFIPKTKEMIFKAAKGQHVLLYDKANHLEVSAPGLKLIRDHATRKETVQGIGDVRFSFVEAEFNQLRRHFNFEKKATVQEVALEKE